MKNRLTGQRPATSRPASRACGCRFATLPAVQSSFKVRLGCRLPLVMPNVNADYLFIRRCAIRNIAPIFVVEPNVAFSAIHANRSSSILLADTLKSIVVTGDFVVRTTIVAILAIATSLMRNKTSHLRIDGGGTQEYRFPRGRHGAFPAPTIEGSRANHSDDATNSPERLRSVGPAWSKCRFVRKGDEAMQPQNKAAVY
jgi:hypothetical protein